MSSYTSDQRLQLAHRQEGRRGNVLVETCLSATFLTAMFLGVWQYGYTFYLYNQLESAVRAGARYASMRTYNSVNGTPTSDFSTAVQNVVVYGTPAPNANATPVIPNLTTENVGLTVTFTSVPTQVAVSINNFKMNTFYGTIPLNGKPITTFPYVGVYGPP